MAVVSSVVEMPVFEILRRRFGVERAQVAAIAQRFQIVEVSLFGSALRDDFRVDGDDPSDVDLLVLFETGSRLDWQRWLLLETSVEQLFGRKVDLCQKQQLHNPYSRNAILQSCRVIYVR
jgi:uncharacterized protein